MISIIVPTYKEVENLEPLSKMIADAMTGYDYETIIMDDNSQKG